MQCCPGSAAPCPCWQRVMETNVIVRRGRWKLQQCCRSGAGRQQPLLSTAGLRRAGKGDWSPGVSTNPGTLVSPHGYGHQAAWMPTSARTSCQHSHLNREGLELETPHPTHELAVAPSPSQLSGVVCTARCTTSSEILCRTLCRTGSSSGCIHLQPRCWNQDSGSMHGTASVQLCQRGRAAQPGTRYPLLYPTTDADKRRIGRRGSEPTAEPRSRSKISTSPQPAPEGSGRIGPKRRTSR